MHHNKRYWVNNKYFNQTGPVFIMVAGEYEDSAYDAVFGAWVEYASHLNALCVVLEHRFYGRTHPTP